MSTIQNQSSPTPDPATPSVTVSKKLRWIGLAAFGFFLIKGLLWLTLPAILLWWHNSGGS